MARLGTGILNILNKTYEPSTMVEARYQRYDLAFKTDTEGRPVMLFMGQKDDHGKIKGERLVRRMVFDNDGRLVKDHWDNKGPAT